MFEVAINNLVVIQLNIKLYQMTNLDVIFYMVVSIYRLDKICNSTQCNIIIMEGVRHRGLK